MKENVPAELPGFYGIGHTRWATHGEVNDINAHPHMDASGKIAIVHNGIIENYLTLRDKLISEGYTFETETDSEVIAHLIADRYDGDLETAVRETVHLLKGTYGIVSIHADEPGKLVGARNGSPLVLGIGDGEMFLASDVTAMMAYTKQVVYIEDGEVVSLDCDGFRTSDLMDREIAKEVDHIEWELQEIEKDGFVHFMEKEINEQPESISRAMSGRLDVEHATGHLGGLNLSSKELHDIERVKIISIGTSYYASMVGAYLLETVARVPSIAEVASEVRYKNPIVEKNTIYFAVTQSGETADTLAALREAKKRRATTLAVCNVLGRSIAREAD